MRKWYPLYKLTEKKEGINEGTKKTHTKPKHNEIFEPDTNALKRQKLVEKTHTERHSVMCFSTLGLMHLHRNSNECMRVKFIFYTMFLVSALVDTSRVLRLALVNACRALHIGWSMLIGQCTEFIHILQAKGILFVRVNFFPLPHFMRYVNRQLLRCIIPIKTKRQCTLRWCR